MERGLLWLSLLLVFFWLAVSGWREYQKVEAYKIWAEDFDTAKYDIYAVLGKKGKFLTWGKPTISGVVVEETFSLEDVCTINLLVNGHICDGNDLPKSGSVVLQFIMDDISREIPFTEISLAAKWRDFLENEDKSNE